MPVQSQQDQDYLTKVQGDLENAKKRSSISTPTQAALATPQGSSIVSKNMESSIEPKRNFPNPNRRASIINHNVPAEAGMDPDAESMKGFQMVLEMICAASLDAVVIIDTVGIIKTANEEFLNMFMYDRWEVIGKNINTMMPERFAKIHDGIIKRYMKSKMKRIIGELRDNAFALKKNGEEFPVVLKVSELTSATGDMVFIGIVKNISFEQELMKIKDMIANMLPPAITKKLGEGITEIAEEVQGSVAFVDICSFHSFMSVTSPKDVVKELNRVFRYFDGLCDKFGVEKIKTIGDIYMVACTSGTTTTRVFDYAIRLCEFCYAAIQFTKSETKFHVRAGVGTGNIIQGVLSGSRVSFDIWSDCVNIAARLQKRADPDGIMVCNNTYNHTNFKYDFRINQLEIKGKGLLDCYALARKKN